MVKEIKKAKMVKETSFSRKLDRLEDLRGILVSTIFSLSDLIDDLTGYNKVNGKRYQ